MTSRHRRSVLPLLTALLVGAAGAGTATVMAKPFDGDGTAGRVDLGATLTPSPDAPNGGPLGRASSPPSPGAPAPVSPSPTASQPAAPTTTTTTDPPAPPSSTQPTSQPPADSATGRVVDLVNEARTAEGCGPVRVDASLTTAASSHSDDMSNRDYFSHTTPEGVTFDERIKNSGHPSPGAENIARGQQSAESVMDAWMKSKGHRTNILNCKLTAIGVGLDTDGWFWTQDFGY